VREYGTQVRAPSRLLAFLLVASSATWASEGGRPLDVAYRDGRVTARLAGTPLDEVLTRLARETGAEIVGDAIYFRDVHAEFDAIPLPDVLRRLLGLQSFVVRYGRGDAVTRIELLGGPQLPVVRRTPLNATPSNFYWRMATRPPITLGAALADELGVPQARSPRLLRVAVVNANEARRRDALLTVLREVEADAQLRSEAVLTLRLNPDQSLAETLRETAPRRAEELVTTVSGETTDEYFRRRATNILELLQNAERADVPAALAESDADAQRRLAQVAELTAAERRRLRRTAGRR
jgi:hypothetical protein